MKFIFKEEFGFRTVKAGVRTVYSPKTFLNESLMLTGDLNLAVVDIEVTSSTSSIDEHCNWASDFTGERASESTDRITWQHIPIQCHSWKEFNGFLEEKISSGEFIGDEIFFNEDTKTIWFDSFQYRKTHDGKDAYDFYTYYIVFGD